MSEPSITDEMIRAELASGRPVLDVATNLGVSYYRVKCISLSVPRKNPRRMVTPEKRAAIERALRMGRGREEIRKSLRCSGVTVQAIANEMKARESQ